MFYNQSDFARVAQEHGKLPLLPTPSLSKGQQQWPRWRRIKPEAESTTVHPTAAGPIAYFSDFCFLLCSLLCLQPWVTFKPAQRQGKGSLGIGTERGREAGIGGKGVWKLDTWLPNGDLPSRPFPPSVLILWKAFGQIVKLFVFEEIPVRIC